MMLLTRPRRSKPRTLTLPTLVVDDAGQVWRHDNPAELYRRIARRNELLRTIAGAPRVPTSGAR